MRKLVPSVLALVAVTLAAPAFPQPPASQDDRPQLRVTCTDPARNGGRGDCAFIITNVRGRSIAEIEDICRRLASDLLGRMPFALVQELLGRMRGIGRQQSNDPVGNLCGILAAQATIEPTTRPGGSPVV